MTRKIDVRCGTCHKQLESYEGETIAYCRNKEKCGFKERCSKCGGGNIYACGGGKDCKDCGYSMSAWDQGVPF